MNQCSKMGKEENTPIYLLLKYTFFQNVNYDFIVESIKK